MVCASAMRTLPKKTTTSPCASPSRSMLQKKQTRHGRLRWRRRGCWRRSGRRRGRRGRVAAKAAPSRLRESNRRSFMGALSHLTLRGAGKSSRKCFCAARKEGCGEIDSTLEKKKQSPSLAQAGFRCAQDDNLFLCTNVANSTLELEPHAELNPAWRGYEVT